VFLSSFVTALTARGIPVVRTHGSLCPADISNQRIDFSVKSAEDWIVDPCLLHKLKLALDISVEAEKKQPAIYMIRNSRIARTMSVGSTTAQNSMTIGRSKRFVAVGTERIAWV
jgi:hypothetical protein